LQKFDRSRTDIHTDECRLALLDDAQSYLPLPSDAARIPSGRVLDNGLFTSPQALQSPTAHQCPFLPQKDVPRAAVFQSGPHLSRSTVWYRERGVAPLYSPIANAVIRTLLDASTFSTFPALGPAGGNRSGRTGRDRPGHYLLPHLA